MRNTKNKMLQIYKPYSNLDWMNYKLVKKDITFHHIVKRENGGGKDISNGALLMPLSHQYLHIIEYKEIEIYNAINKMFLFINKQQHEPTTEQRQIIEYFLLEFENAHKGDKNSKGNALIKYKYLQRGL